MKQERMALPRSRSGVDRVNPKILLLYGNQKVGKSTLAANLKNCIILDHEDGYAFLNVKKKIIKNTADLYFFLDLIKNASQGEGKPIYKRAVIDSLTVFEYFVSELAAEDYNSINGTSYNNLNEVNDYWNTMNFLREKMREVLSAIASNFETLVIIAHLRDKSVTKNSETITVADIAATGNIAEIISGISDATGRLVRKQDGTLLAQFNVENSGARCGHLINKEILLQKGGTDPQVMDLSKLIIGHDEEVEEELHEDELNEWGVKLSLLNNKEE